MKSSKKLIIIIVSVLVLTIGGGVAYATNTPTARADRELKLANKYLHDGKYQEAILAFQKVIEIEPKNIPARLGLGKVYVATKEFTKAEVVLKEVIGIDKNNIPAREELFKVYLAEGNLDAANDILHEIIQIDPNKDIKQLKADLEAAKAATTPTELSPSTLQTSGESIIKEIIFTSKHMQDLISKGWKHGRKICCYLDESKKIAYYGEFILDEKSSIGKTFVIRIHNPSIYPISVIPDNDSIEAYRVAKQVVTKYKPTEAIKYNDRNFDRYFPVIMVGNDFEGDLLKAGISLESISFTDKPSY